MGRDDNNGVNTGSAPPSVPAEIQQLAEMQKELNRVLNALALELPASVHQDAAGRIRLCCAAMRDVSYQLGVATERARGGLDVEAMRTNLHATFNGGHQTPEAIKAFHHGMDTVCNVLEAQQQGKGTNSILPPASSDGGTQG